jgi:predicted RNA-binding protein associated with RNAse of E/G family
MMHFAITEEDFNKAYDEAAEIIKEEWHDNFGPEGEVFEEWAGDILNDYLNEFLRALNISVVE